MKNKIKLYFIYMPDANGKIYVLYHDSLEKTWYSTRRIRRANFFMNKREAHNYIANNGLADNGVHPKVGCLKSKINL